MAMTVDDLRNQLSGLSEYVPEDEATLRQRATDIYSPQYQSDLNKLRDQIEFQVGRQQRQAVGTGMQRSSYNSAQQASIRRGGLQSQADLAINYETSIANLLNDLLEKEKDRKLDADRYRDSLLLQLYGLENKGGSGGGGLTAAKKAFTKAGLAGVNAGLNTVLSSLLKNGVNNTSSASTGYYPVSGNGLTTSPAYSYSADTDKNNYTSTGSLLDNIRYSTQPDNYTKVLNNKLKNNLMR